MAQQDDNLALFDSNTTYSNCSNPKGLALIISNLKSKAEPNANKLTALFNEFGYRVLRKQNLSAQEICNEVKKFADDKRQKRHDSCILCFMTKGNFSELIGTDHKRCNVLEAASLLDSPAISGKPKLCFALTFDTPRRPSVSVIKTRIYEEDLNRLSKMQAAIPPDRDMMLAVCCLPTSVDQSNCCWFVQALYEVFQTHYRNQDLVTMMSDVNTMVKGALCSAGYHRFIPVPFSRPKKKFYFSL